MKLPLVRSALCDKKSALMRHTPVSFISRSTALLCIIAWFFASNHCALSALIQRVANHSPVMQCAHCPTKGGSERDNPSTPMPGCCKDVKATAATEMAIVLAPLVSGETCMGLWLLQIPTPALWDQFNGTGPPTVPSFAEAILSRSFQSHAPPLVI